MNEAQQNNDESLKTSNEDARGEIENLDLLLEGCVFLKYGKWGDPAYRIVKISTDLKNLEWIHRGETKPAGSIPVSKLIGIKYGRHTSNFKKKKASEEELCFTIFGEDRNLDLEADTKAQMELFVEGMISLIKYHKNHNPDLFKGPKLGGKKK